MSLTRPQVRALLYGMVPGLGLVSTADSFAAGSVTDAFTLQDSNRGPNKWRGTYIYRPSFLTNDRVKKAGTLNGATLLQTGSAYDGAFLTTLPYEIVGLVHPDELNACILRALQRVLFETQLCYSMYPDGDNGAASAIAFTPQDTGGVSSKGSTAITQVDTGSYSLIFSGGAGLNSYTETGLVTVEPLDTLYNAANCRLQNPGTTLQFRLWDATNNVEIGSPMSHSQRSWTHLHRVDQVPAGCYQVKARLQVNEANAVAIWDNIPAQNLSDYRLTAPSWLDEKYKLASFGEAIYRHSTVASAAATQGQEASASRQWEHWMTPRDYALEIFKSESVANRLIVNRNRGPQSSVRLRQNSVNEGALPRNDLWFHGLRPYTDAPGGTFQNETDTTNAPQFQLLEASMYELALLCKERYPDEARWQRWVIEKAQTREAERESRPVTPERRQRQNYGGRI